MIIVSEFFHFLPGASHKSDNCTYFWDLLILTESIHVMSALYSMYQVVATIAFFLGGKKKKRSLSLSLSIYIYIYICMRLCVCGVNT